MILFPSAVLGQVHTKPSTKTKNIHGLDHKGLKADQSTGL